MRLVREEFPEGMFLTPSAGVKGVELSGATEAAQLGEKLTEDALVSLDSGFDMPQHLSRAQAKEAIYLEKALFATLAKDSNPGPFSLRAIDHDIGAPLPTSHAGQILERVVPDRKPLTIIELGAMALALLPEVDPTSKVIARLPKDLIDYTPIKRHGITPNKIENNLPSDNKYRVRPRHEY